ncbi:hypothetical protein PIROE2DRAFT_8664 [Piromyces sp. E2]|nr:hypothetical protein PIROE2DRAFT_8664 [Piromyces sp. E2]|eukprot:OUM64507.1 hypothetical protein PIROE2DRAFT_8664 [Piromyces sp. E2]
MVSIFGATTLPNTNIELQIVLWHPHSIISKRDWYGYAVSLTIALYCYINDIKLGTPCYHKDIGNI